MGLAVLAVLPPIPPWLPGAALVALLTATVVDAIFARRKPQVQRTLSNTVARGARTRLTITATAPSASRVQIRQPRTPELRVEPQEAIGDLQAHLVGEHRGVHDLPAVALRLTGPLGLGRWDHSACGTTTITVFPDLPGAWRQAAARRQGKTAREEGRVRGPMGLGTDFESIRDYSPDDDVRQINWQATSRLQQPMSNRYRIEQDRNLICAIDTGRLMSAPVGLATRLDLSLDALAAVAVAAEEEGDRIGALAFAGEILRMVNPCHHGSARVVRALFDLEVRMEESDFALAFRTVAGRKRSLIVVFTDIMDDAASRSLLESVPTLVRKHAVLVASVRDPDLARAVSRAPRRPLDAYAASVAVGLLDDRARVISRLRRMGAMVAEAEPDRLGVACVAGYMTLKNRARL